MALQSMAMATRKTLGRTLSRQGLLGLGPLQSRSITTFSLPELPYDYNALEPVISAEIMQLHHQKHHQAYVTNYNKAVGQLADAIDKGDAPSVVKLQSAIKFNGGGHLISLSHSSYFNSLSIMVFIVFMLERSVLSVSSS
ncbi:hypothetical protein Dimus_022439 [Dionaea muscipula]